MGNTESPAFPKHVLHAEHSKVDCSLSRYVEIVHSRTPSPELLKVSRNQLPLMPAAACPLYSLQGATCDPGLIAHFVMPKRADGDIKWLCVYVLLSRVRSLSRLRSIGLTSKIRQIIEGGPPKMLAENFEKLFREKS